MPPVRKYFCKKCYGRIIVKYTRTFNYGSHITPIIQISNETVVINFMNGFITADYIEPTMLQTEGKEYKVFEIKSVQCKRNKEHDIGWNFDYNEFCLVPRNAIERLTE